MSHEDKCDDEAGKLFVGGLSWETTKESLSGYFEKYGEVIDCVVMKDNSSGKSRGFGFVTFKEADMADAALNESPHLLDGRAIDPKPCNPRNAQLKKKNNNFKVFLGGLPNNITESDLQAFFSNYGNVTEVNIMYDQEKQKCRGFGFLSFDNEEAVQKACVDHFVHIKGKQVECKFAVTKSSTNQMGMANGRNNMQQMGGMWNQMGGMPNNNMGPNGGFQQGWGGNQQGQFPGQFNQNPGFQNCGYNYGNAQPQFGNQGYGNYGNAQPGNNYYGNYQQGPNAQGNQGANQGYMGPGMGQNQMGGPSGMSTMTEGAEQYSNMGNMGNYPHEPSSYGPSRGFGNGGNNGPMGPGGMANNGYMPQGGYNNNQGNGYGNVGSVTGGQNDGPPGGRGGAQQNTGYHPYRR